MDHKPKAASSPKPKLNGIKSRPAIASQIQRERKKEEVLSPIPTSKEDRSNLEQESDNEEYNFSDNENISEDETVSKSKVDGSTDESSKRSFCNENFYIYPIIGLLFVSFGISQYITSPQDITPYKSLETIKLDFPGQTDDFWLSVNISINEIQRSERPKSIVFLYEKQSQNFLRKLINQLSHYALCRLNTCEAKEIVLTPEYFRRPDILQDYGQIIISHRDNLSENGVMIVEHIENIPGITAQAFHSFCDEDNPVVNRALFLFTMQVDRMPEEDKDVMGYVERNLKVKWSDIKSDNFQPLVTRMTGFVLPVR